MNRELMCRDEAGVSYFVVYQGNDCPLIYAEKDGEFLGKFHPLSVEELRQRLQAEPVIMVVGIEDYSADYGFDGLVVDPKDAAVVASFCYHDCYIRAGTKETGTGGVVDEAYIDMQQATAGAISSYFDNGAFGIVVPPKEDIVMRGVRYGGDLFTVVFRSDGTYSVEQE